VPLRENSFHHIRPAGRLRLAIGLVLCALPFPAWSGVATAQQASAAQKRADTALLNRAKGLIQSGHAQEALSLLDQAGQQPDLQSTDASEIHTLKGICFAVLARPIESQGEFDRAIALRPDYAPAYLSSGLAAASFNNLDRAQEQLATAVRLAPDLPGARYNYALVLARAAKYTESEKQVDLEMADKGPKMEAPVDLWKLKARDAYYQKKWQDSADAYRRVLEFQPDWAEAYAGIGEALFSLNRTQESETALKKALDLDPKDGAAHETLGKLYQDEAKEDAAIAEFEADLRERPGDREALYRLFRIYTKRGDTANAARLQKQIKDLVEGNMTASLNEAKATALNNLGIELEEKGDFASALEDYDQAAKTDMTNIIFQRNAALLLCKMGRTQEAIRRLRDILSLDADDAETLQILAVANELASGDVNKQQRLPQPQSSR
jgi:tetratricopeptide (TPR) repeat protein